MEEHTEEAKREEEAARIPVSNLSHADGSSLTLDFKRLKLPFMPVLSQISAYAYCKVI